MRADDVRQKISKLLIEWCDALIKLQVNMPGSSLDGGILCPACGTIHGRCHEAVYPLLCASRLTKDEKYLTAARRLFAFGENMRCSDGAFRNDFKSEWKGVTVFAAVALCDALNYHADLLEPEEREQWEKRLRGMGEWLCRNLTDRYPAYINYYAANACAMALLGNYFTNRGYLSLSTELARRCLNNITENYLIFGEGRSDCVRSPKGCPAVDIGYNVEETLPSLTRYALAAGHKEFLKLCRCLWRSHLEWMLPDGGWDNSAGTRSFKWTYWGSRTADGCQQALFELGKEEPVFAEAAMRNLELYEKCTYNGLLTGGPDYAIAGEKTCVHHTFCHAKVLASCLDGEIPEFERVYLPCDNSKRVSYCRDMDTYRVSWGKWRMDISGYDYSYSGANHVSGGCISLLWHENTGAVIAAGSIDKKLREPHNQQLPSQPEIWKIGCPRIESVGGGKIYGQQYCKEAELSAEIKDDCPVIKAEAFLCDERGKKMPEGKCIVEYSPMQEGLYIKGSVEIRPADKVCYVLPLIGNKARVEILKGRLSAPPEKGFYLSPGFLGEEYRIVPDTDGNFTVKIVV